jgi:hypothetical protein
MSQNMQHSESRILYVLYFVAICRGIDRFCVLVVRVLGYRSGGLGSIPGTTMKKKWVWNGVHPAS